MHSALGANMVVKGQSVDDSSNTQRAQQFSKTKLCKFELLGICAKGRACPFAHGDTELKPLPDLRRTKLCSSLLQTGHCSNPDCTFAHSREELRMTSTFRKTKLCRFMQTGHCTLGWKCNFAHSQEEVRPLDSARNEASEKGGNSRMPYKVPLDTVIEPPSAMELGWESNLHGAAAEWLAWGDIYANHYQNDLTGMMPPGIESPWPSALPAGSSPVDEPAYISLGGRGSLVVDQSDAWQVKPGPMGSNCKYSPLRSVRTSTSTLCTLGDDNPLWGSTQAS